MRKQIIRWGMVIAIGMVAYPMMAANKEAHKHDGHKMTHGKMDHKQHRRMNQGGLKVLSQVPASGKAREAGFDGRYAMEPTTMPSRMANRCALASRGIIMLDEQSWKLCGGKPKGASPGPKKAKKAAHQRH